MRVAAVPARRLSLALLASLALASCGGLPVSVAPAKSVSVQVDIRAAADVNPDSARRPSPVVLRIYELRTQGEFDKADFFNLYDGEASVLGAALVTRTEYLINPSEQRSVVLSLPPDVKFLGFLAGYRDLGSAVWRLSVATAAGTVTLRLDANAMQFGTH